jgi:hypothetical protein
MSGTPARSTSTPAAARTPAERLEAVDALAAGARERIDRSPGFLGSLDDGAIEAHLAGDLPEVLGTWPDQKAGSEPA